MLKGFYRRLAERSRRKDRSFEEFIEYVKATYGDAVTLVLFGSRARGDCNMLSDYDVLVICRVEVYDKLRSVKPAWVQLFHYSQERLDRAIELFDTIIADAAVEGALLHDGLGLWNMVRDRIFEEIRRRGVEKTGIGWVKKKENNV